MIRDWLLRRLEQRVIAQIQASEKRIRDEMAQTVKEYADAIKTSFEQFQQAMN